MKKPEAGSSMGTEFLIEGLRAQSLVSYRVKKAPFPICQILLQFLPQFMREICTQKQPLVDSFTRLGITYADKIQMFTCASQCRAGGWANQCSLQPQHTHRMADVKLPGHTTIPCGSVLTGSSSLGSQDKAFHHLSTKNLFAGGSRD